MPLAVIAIGGNALTRVGEAGTIEEQFANARQTCEKLAKLVHRGWEIVLTHGNGPQVGAIMWRVELARQTVHPVDLGICDANSQGQIGYMLQQVLSHQFALQEIDRSAITLVTQVEVDAADPAFENPTKGIGPFFTEAQARERMSEYGWVMKEDAGRGWRRMVPSPRPEYIVELDAIRLMARSRYVPIAVGGGGIPVVRDGNGQLDGIEAVIDKDLTSSLLARQLRADALVICTAVDRVALGFGSDEPDWLDTVSMEELAGHRARGEFPAGSMGPKVDAVLEYMADTTGSPLRRAVITDFDHLIDAMAGRAGTRVEL
ncbi:MAG: carbamate kinase [Myxococcota bacterium]